MNSAAGADEIALQHMLRQRLRVAPAPDVPEIRLHLAHSGSGLRDIARHLDAPYFAYAWAGGIVLARHVLDGGVEVAGRRVLDLGSGSGLVAIAAALRGACVVAAETDPLGRAAVAINAGLNGVAVEVTGADLLDAAPPGVDLVLAGDVFYAEGLARRVLPFLERCRDAGIDVLVGDPGRAHLPLECLERVARRAVADFGTGAAAEAGIYKLRSRCMAAMP